MGNSVRHTLHQLCGAESAKEVPDADRPVERSKESKKKKSKKGKKNKKVRNDKLSSIQEENEGEPNENNVLPPVQEEGGQNKDLSNGPHKPEDTIIPADESCDQEELVSSGEQSTVPLIKIDCASDSASNEGSEKAVDEVSCVKEEEGDTVSLISCSQDDALKNKSVLTCSFKPIKSEPLGIEAADKIFQTASTAYEPFIESGSKFQGAILDIQQCVDVEKKSTDLLALWQVYKDKCTVEMENMNAGEKEDILADLEAVKAAASALLQVIGTVKPALDKCTEDANNIDVIECTKDKILEGEEVMGTEKFSTPGKYRRNMARLKKCALQIVDIELETNEICHCLQDYLDKFGHTVELLDHPLPSIRESIIVPEEKTPVEACNDIDDIFSNLSQESVPIYSSECDLDSVNDRPRTPLPPADSLEAPDTNRSRLSSGSHSDHDPTDVFIKVYYESDECSQDCVQVSTDISTTTKKLDNELISVNKIPVAPLVADNNDNHTDNDNDNDNDNDISLPQVQFEEEEGTDELSLHVESSINENEFHAAAEPDCLAESTSELECLPDDISISENNDANACEHSLDESTLNVSIISMQHQYAPEQEISHDSDTCEPPHIHVTCLDDEESDGVCSSDGKINLEIDNEHVEVESIDASLNMEVIDGNVIDHDDSELSACLDNDITDPHHDDPTDQETDIGKDCSSFIELESPSFIELESEPGMSECDNASVNSELTHVNISVLEPSKALSETDELHHLTETAEESALNISLESENLDTDINKNDSIAELEVEQETLTSVDSHVLEVESSDNDEIDDPCHDSGTPDQTASSISLESECPETDVKRNDSSRELESDTADEPVTAMSPESGDEETFDTESYNIPHENNVVSPVNILELESVDTRPNEIDNDSSSSDDSSQKEVIVHEVYEVEEVTEIFVDENPVESEPNFIRSSTPDVIYIEHDCDSDSESGSNATSIQEIEIFPVSKPTDRSIDNSHNNSEASRLRSESSTSNARDEKLDVALTALKEGIDNEDVQDEFVDLICSSISQVLEDDGKPPVIRLPSSESSHEETSLQKSFQHSREVLDWVGAHFSDESTNYDKDTSEQCIFVPEKDSVHSPHIISHTILKSDNKVRQSSRVDDDHVRTVSVSLEDLIAADPSEHNIPEEEQIQTFVIKSHSETNILNDAITQLNSAPPRCYTPPLMLDPEPDHNTLEYGNYVFIDPSTGDIQVMRNRSRSLDSLVSMASSRSSISRFGSFEFVTDFEINIAEKNQEMMNAK